MKETIAVVGDRSEVLEQLRAYTNAFDDSVRQLGAGLGLPESDTTALAEIMWAETSGASMSPARLSERVGLTSGATTALINRLESAGHIARSRESTDRRVVTLRPTATSRHRAEELLRVSQASIDRALDPFTADELRTCAAVVRAVVEGTSEGTRAMDPGDGHARRPRPRS